MRASVRAAATMMLQIAAIGLLVLLYAYGARIAVKAIALLAQGKETDPSGHAHPAWTLIHFASSLLFAVLAMMQLVAAIRRRHPEFHRYAGRVAVAFGLIAAVTGASVPFAAVPPHPMVERVYILIHFAGAAACLLMGFRAARHRTFALHRVWMMRAIATIGAVMTQRIVFPILLFSFGAESDAGFWVAFVVAFALGWAINLALAEGWVRWTSCAPRPSVAGLPW
jgi:hypothetical protein